MNGQNEAPLKGIGTDVFNLAASFALNGTSSPVAASSLYAPGFLWTVARTGVGLFVVTLDPSMALPSAPLYIEANPQCNTFAEWFDTLIVGAFNTTTRSFSIQTHRSGVAQETAVGAGNRVNWSIYFRNTTAR